MWNCGDSRIPPKGAILVAVRDWRTFSIGYARLLDMRYCDCLYVSELQNIECARLHDCGAYMIARRD